MAQRIVPEMAHYSQRAVLKPRPGLDQSAYRVPAPWERVKPIKPVTEEHKETIIKYYPFKDCLDDYQNRPLFDTV
ncbi:hypothetical protein SS1G_11692 [Sclerotinia sclerotiorum 1980 UF-70]|uniref:Uncharacterized protein n=1 Tax=Sclerotinia sclerotiorum (strain ATCC 18683 / 1980 / Ss-1) TaxID=665079 RepID=A7F271_SCLS1|nr:hypothetical protein SS1G_11692 [Sclerotinia sclerotiorum 1980 UF-70]EDN95813.1 hypothetical protein SS1G_11692 [Sclerotinia sclerotiorum 1980 UF-70]